MLFRGVELALPTLVNNVIYNELINYKYNRGSHTLFKNETSMKNEKLWSEKRSEFCFLKKD